MQKKDVLFKFKGDRSYVQGPDIFNAIIRDNKNSKISDIDFSMHNFIYQPNCCIYTTDVLFEYTEAAKFMPVRCRMIEDGKKIFKLLNINEVAGDRIEKIDYNEAKIFQMCLLDANTISVTNRSPFTFIETIVSMNKYLLGKQIDDQNGKWVFMKIKLFGEYVDVRKNLSLTIARQFGSRLVETNIYHNTKLIGNLQFSLVKS
jgi:hypothetical protein